MPVVTVYRNGTKAGVAPGPSDHERAKRDTCQGWTAKSARGNLEFLRSVDLTALTGLGHSFTLSVSECPPSAAVWTAMRKAWVERLRRAGLFRLHWVTEWQRRGVPHLHGVAYFRDPETHRDYACQDRLLRQAWLEVAAEYGADTNGQRIKPIFDALGWLEYLAKHAARGADHYQRSNDSIPPGWKSETGRMWGKSGDWPVVGPLQVELSHHAYWILRRWIQRWRLAHARRDKNRAVRARRITSARTMLHARNCSLGETRGVSEWIAEATVLRMIHVLAERGHVVQC